MLPWQAKVGLIMVSGLPIFIGWATYNTSGIDQATVNSVRNNNFAFAGILTVFNFGLLTILALSVEKHPTFYKDMVSTGKFWKQIDK